MEKANDVGGIQVSSDKPIQPANAVSIPKRKRTPAKAYADHKHQAKDRFIEFNLSYADWLEMWLASGKYEMRGRLRGQYQVCRYYDEGAYSLTNCYIGTVEQNQKDSHQIPEGETGAILKDWLTGKYTQYQLGEIYGVGQPAISRIINRERRASY